MIALLTTIVVTQAQTLTITSVSGPKSPQDFVKSSQRLIAVLSGEARADSSQRIDSTLSVIVFAQGVKIEISKEEYNRVLDLYAQKRQGYIYIPTPSSNYQPNTLTLPERLKQMESEQERKKRADAAAASAFHW